MKVSLIRNLAKYIV